jgi:hypothetical protein
LPARIELLLKRLADIDNLQRTLQDHHAGLLELLQSVKGAGAAIASTFIADLPEMGLLTHKLITHLAGLQLLNRKSGAFSEQRHIPDGRASACIVCATSPRW